MLIRSVRPGDWPAVRDLAARLAVDYEGMEEDRFWVAEDEGRIVGQVGLKQRSDCLELVGLGTEPSRRKAGVGGRLIEALFSATDGDVYMTTIIPGYFSRHGFAPATVVPAGMAKDHAWCESCPRTGCTVMVRRKP